MGSSSIPSVTHRVPSRWISLLSYISAVGFEFHFFHTGMLCARVDLCDSKDTWRVGHEWLFQTMDTFRPVAYKKALPSNPPFQILLQTPGWLGEIIRSLNIGGRKHVLLDDLWPLLTPSSEVVSTLHQRPWKSTQYIIHQAHHTGSVGVRGGLDPSRVYFMCCVSPSFIFIPESDPFFAARESGRCQRVGC